MQIDHDVEALKAAAFLLGDLKESFQEMGIHWGFVHEYQDGYCKLLEKTGPCVPIYLGCADDYEFKSFQEVKSYVDDNIGDIAYHLEIEDQNIDILYFAYVDMRVIYTVKRREFISSKEPDEPYIDQSVFNRRAA